MEVISNDLLFLSRDLHRAAENGQFTEAARLRKEFHARATAQMPDPEELLFTARCRRAEEMPSFAHDLFDAVLSYTRPGSFCFEEAHKEIGVLRPKLVQSFAIERGISSENIIPARDYFIFCANATTTEYTPEFLILREKYPQAGRDYDVYMAARRTSLAKTLEAVERATGPYGALPFVASLSCEVPPEFITTMVAAWDTGDKIYLADPTASGEAKGTQMMTTIYDLSEQERQGIRVPREMGKAVAASWDNVLDGLIVEDPFLAGGFVGDTATLLSPNSFLKEPLLAKTDALCACAPEAYHDGVAQSLPKGHTPRSFLTMTASGSSKRGGHLRVI